MKEEMVGNSGSGDSSTARRYQEKNKGTSTKGGECWPTSLNDGGTDFESALPNEDPQTLVDQADAAARRVGDNSRL